MALVAGTRLARYEVRSKIGAGGMGEVYLAEDTQLDRKVALKILLPEFAKDAERMSRFIREAKSASALNHPNIITIHEIGTAGDTHFIASEYIEGETLFAQLKHEALPLKATLDIAIQVASALDTAHRAGIVHRDIKSENVIVRPDGLVKILDFGIAKLAEERHGDATRRFGEGDDTLMPASPHHSTSVSPKTKPGMVMGTAHYMSPEQARGKAVDARSDIFSFGLVLYEMLTGKRAFHGESAMDVMGAILYKEPPPLNQLLPHLPHEIERIVNKTLRKDRDERYQTAKDLLIDLKDAKQELEFQDKLERTVPPQREDPKTQLLTAAATHDTRPLIPSAEFIARKVNKHKLGVALCAAILLALVGFGYWYFFLRSANSNGPIDSIAVLAFQNWSPDADTEYLSDGLAESLIYRLSQLPTLRVSPTSSVLRYKGKQIDPIKVGKELRVSAVLSGRISQHGDDLKISAELVDVRHSALLWGEQYEGKTSDLLATQREIAREIVDKLRLKVSGPDRGLAKHDTDSNEAYQLYLKGRYYWNKRTEEGFKKSIDYFNQAIEIDPNYALAYAGLADSFSLIPRFGFFSTKDSFPKAKAAAMKALELDPDLAEAHASLAYVRTFFDWDWPGAEKEFKRAIELNPNYATAHHWYALYLIVAGRQQDALTEVKLAQELEPLSLIINTNAGRLLYYSRRYDNAIEQHKKTIDLNSAYGEVRLWLGKAYLQKAMYPEAIAELKEATRLSQDNPVTMAALGYAFALSGRKAEALKIINQLSKQKYVSPLEIAVLYVGLNEKDQAFAWLDKAYEERSALLTYIRVEPQFDSLRSDPRLTNLIGRIGLPK